MPAVTGELENKPIDVFTNSATSHGGQESIILTTLVPLLHFGMIFVGIPYVQNPQILTTDAIGGSPYGPSTIAALDNSGAVAATMLPSTSPATRAALFLAVSDFLKFIRLDCDGEDTLN